MQNPNVVNLTWSYRIRGEDNSDNCDAWPELCQENQTRNPTRKNNRSQQVCPVQLPCSSKPENQRTLDIMEYPLLGEPSCRAREPITQEKLKSESLRNELVIAPSRFDNYPGQWGRGRRRKRTDKIFINLQDVLKNTMYMKNLNSQQPVRFRINVAKPEQNTQISISISKQRTSRLKKVILACRNIRARQKKNMRIMGIEPSVKDVNDINFNSLKITADPEIDVDYVRGMSELNFYGNDYRAQFDRAMLDDTIGYRADIVDKLNGLRIQNRHVQCKYRGIDNISGAIECDIVDGILAQTFKLDINDDDKPEIKDDVIPDSKPLPRHSRNFREYCTNILTPGLNRSLEKFLCEIARLQRRHYDKDQNKAKYRRRYYSGLKEVEKHVEFHKVKFVIIAPDIEKIQLEGGLDDQVQKLITVCKQQNVVFCFGLRRRKLGYYTHGTGFVGAIGIANYSGTEKLFRNVLTELALARSEYQSLSGDPSSSIDLDKLNLDNYLMSESIAILMKFLSPSICKTEKGT